MMLILGLLLLSSTSYLVACNQIQQVLVSDVKPRSARIAWTSSVSTDSPIAFNLTLYRGVVDVIMSEVVQDTMFVLMELEADTRYNVCVTFNNATLGDSTKCQQFETGNNMAAIFVGGFILVMFVGVVIIDLVCKRERDEIIKRSQAQILADGSINYRTTRGQMVGHENAGFEPLTLDDPGPIVDMHRS
ncbi:uncharacterized protein LOC117106626 [Anneissia japonica]|uniref:uncharacterized protein LOC117106626 n=1 Tax=Anneissia japonica TaxID=1529436 RepID=UPI001425542F|nr:uncharacterized protein LOC117106626 [Anneissia japonica]